MDYSVGVAVSAVENCGVVTLDCSVGVAESAVENCGAGALDCSAGVAESAVARKAITRLTRCLQAVT